MDESTHIFSASPEKLHLAKDSVVSYFSQDDCPSLWDIIIHVREKFPDPRQQVVVTSDFPLSIRSLQSHLIFVEGETDQFVTDVPKLGQDCYCLARIDGTNCELEDCGINSIIVAFSSLYSVSQFDVLVYSDDDSLLSKAWEYVQSNRFDGISYKFPRRFTSKIQIAENGVNVAKYSERLSAAKRKNELDISTISTVVEEFRKEISQGKTAIQSTEDSRSLYSQWLTLLAIQEFDLPPVYVGSYISEYVECYVAYPFEKLSMYERVMFVRDLPEYIGYIGSNVDARSLFACRTKIYPKPVAIFNITKEQMQPDLIEDFDLGTQPLYDYRAFFKESINPFTPPTTGLSASGQGDSDIDRKWSAIFAAMIALADSDIYPSIHNTVVFKARSGEICVAYFDEPLGLVGVLQSPYFGLHAFTISEDEFHHLIDVKILLALWKQNNAASQDAASSFKSVVASARSTFRPAIPIFLLMCVELATGLSGLSYYDQRLRCDRVCVPIVTHSDSKLTPKSSVFDFISLPNLLRDKYAASTITSFGSVNQSTKFKGKIPVSIESFRGCNLL